MEYSDRPTEYKPNGREEDGERKRGGMRDERRERRTAVVGRYIR